CYFYTSPERAGRLGDFLTAPAVSPLFGATLAKALEADASALGAHEFHVVEIGAGKGTLARELWDALRFSPLSRRIHLHLVERSAAARQTWATSLATIPSDRWTGYASETELPASPWSAGALVANELFDNLPV